MLEYSRKLIEHFTHPKNVGEIENPDGMGFVGDPSCGDFLKVTISVENDIINDIKFKCKGCPAAIGTASAMTEMAIGLDLDSASEITDEMIEEHVKGLPDVKKHCSNLGAKALYEAIMDYTHKSIKREEMATAAINIFRKGELS